MSLVISKTHMAMLNGIAFVLEDNLCFSGLILHATFRKKACADSYYFTVLAQRQGSAATRVSGCFYWTSHQPEKQQYSIKVDRTGKKKRIIEEIHTARYGEVIDVVRLGS